MVSLNDSSDAARRRLIQDKTKMLDLAAAQARNEEKKNFRERLKEALENTGYSDMYRDILNYIEGNRDSTPKVLYTGSLHEFGREKGVKIYHILKKVV